MKDAQRILAQLEVNKIAQQKYASNHLLRFLQLQLYVLISMLRDLTVPQIRRLREWAERGSARVRQRAQNERL